jgi:ribonuclease P protein component
MAREQRLTKEIQFKAVYSKGRSWANDLVVLKALPNGLESTRCGFSVSKRLGNAVVRNRVRRLLREGAGLTLKKDGWDMVFIARQAAAEADYNTLRRALEELLSRARLLGTEEISGRQEA